MRKIVAMFFIICLASTAYASDFGEDIVKLSPNGGYVLSRNVINRTIEPGDLFRDFVEIENAGASPLSISSEITGDVSSIAEVENVSLLVPAKSSARVYFAISGFIGEYEGKLIISGDINEEIPIYIKVNEDIRAKPFLIEVRSIKNSFDIRKNVTFQTTIRKIKPELIGNLSLNYSVISDNQSIELESFVIDINTSTTFLRSYYVGEQLKLGEHVLIVEATKDNFSVRGEDSFTLKNSFWHIQILGVVPMWVVILPLAILIIGMGAYYAIKKRIESKKKYKMKMDLKTIPKKSKEFLFLGKIAEKNTEAYLDPGRLTTHGIVAGATGGGKSITAQVIIEEALLKGIAVIVFDPTAQWSGMLRKCTDKKMLALYPKFGLKPQQAQAFKGNVRMIKNARQVINIEKHINPGQIEIFSLNKLDPKEMDIFVASIIRQIFKSDPKEYPGLKVLLVFDEVHRLLPKFGGSGEGFLQIERGCREFRKWGLGIMLVSQVLADFVGEIKANISTEIQMRTRDEGDLKRIETKYGEEFLQSLVKASAGVGMFVNPAYNHARPYFIQFRPILHNTKRLTDEELEKYNKYNDQVDDIEFQIDALEKEKVDVFDLKMELKLIKDKIMTGSFSVVEIYLEGFVPRLKKEWEKLGKQPPERTLEVVSEEEIKKSIEEAKAKHEEVKAKESKSETQTRVQEQKIEDKIVGSFTFDNGAMISSLKELLEFLPVLDNEILAGHVNEKKNDLEKWVTEQFGEDIGKKLNGKIKKEEIISALKEICGGKSKSKDEKK